MSMGTQLRTGSKRLLRDLNRNIVLNILAARGPLSRTDIARRCGLPAATVTRIVAELQDAGVVYEEEGLSSGGRRPLLLHLNREAGYLIGLKLREDELIVAITALDATVLLHHAEPFVADSPPSAVLALTTQLVDRCLTEANIDRSRVLGLGVGLSGLIDSTRGICRFSAILDWHDVDIRTPLEQTLGVPVHVDNDVNTLTVAEHYVGLGRGIDNFLVATVGRGVGLGIILHGELYRGAFGGAGEFGHMTIEPDGPICNCGKHGCLEAVASDYALARDFLHADPGHRVEHTAAIVVEHAQRGDEHALAILHRAGHALGIGIANLINLFNPQLVIVGGEGTRAGDLLLEPMRQAIPQHTFGRLGDDAQLIVLSKQDVDWARGAATLVLRELYRPPLYQTTHSATVDALLSTSMLNTPSAASETMMSHLLASVPATGTRDVQLGTRHDASATGTATGTTTGTTIDRSLLTQTHPS